MDNTMRRLAGKRTFWLVMMVPLILIAILFFNLGGNVKPETIRAFVDDKWVEALQIRDWMRENGVESIKLLNSRNRAFGSGVSIKTGRLYCYYDGPGAGKLLQPSFSLEDTSEVYEKQAQVEKIAQQYGVYAYIVHADLFEAVLAQDPYNRPAGMEGTSVFYSESPIDGAENLGGGWYAAYKDGEPAAFTMPVEIWILIALIALTIVISAVISLLYKKYGCYAELTEKKRVYVGRRPRIVNYIQGVYVNVFDDFNAYHVTFITDKDEKLEFYVHKYQFDELNEKTRGYLKYKRLGNMPRFIGFEEADE